jgi:hypothetical protein
MKFHTRIQNEKPRTLAVGVLCYYAVYCLLYSVYSLPRKF